jgi:hypothetical protein
LYRYFTSSSQNQPSPSATSVAGVYSTSTSEGASPQGGLLKRGRYSLLSTLNSLLPRAPLLCPPGAWLPAEFVNFANSYHSRTPHLTIRSLASGGDLMPLIPAIRATPRYRPLACHPAPTFSAFSARFAHPHLTIRSVAIARPDMRHGDTEGTEGGRGANGAPLGRSHIRPTGRPAVAVPDPRPPTPERIGFSPAAAVPLHACPPLAGSTLHSRLSTLNSPRPFPIRHPERMGFPPGTFFAPTHGVSSGHFTSHLSPLTSHLSPLSPPPGGLPGRTSRASAASNRRGAVRRRRCGPRSS